MKAGVKALIVGLIIAAVIIAVIGYFIWFRGSNRHASAQLKNQTERFTTSNTPWNSAIDQFVYDYVSSELGEKPESKA